MTIIQPTQVKHKTKERNYAIYSPDSLCSKGETRKVTVREISRAFPALIRNKQRLYSYDLSPRREVPFFHHAVSLNNKKICKEQEELALFGIIELYCWKDLSQPKIQVLSQSLDVFGGIARNSATSTNGLDTLGSWQGLSHRRLSSSGGPSSGTKQYKPMPFSAWKPDKGFLIAVLTPLTSWDIKLPFFRLLLTGHNSLTSGHTTSTPHAGNLPDWQHPLQCMEPGKKTLPHGAQSGCYLQEMGH